MKNWLKLILWIVGIWIFIKSAPIFISMSGEYSHFIKTAEQRELNVTGLFYSEVPETFEAEKKINIVRKEVKYD